MITRVVLENFKSIASCDVKLGPLTFLVGPNGAGKSNFLDALRFVSDSLSMSLDLGFACIHVPLRAGAGPLPSAFGVRLEFQLDCGASGYYAFRISVCGYEHLVEKEECFITCANSTTHFEVSAGEVQSSNSLLMPAASADRLYLVNASGLPEFRPVYDALGDMEFYNLEVGQFRSMQPSNDGRVLKRSGSNIASVLSNMADHAPSLKERVEEHLRLILPSFDHFEILRVGNEDLLMFHIRMGGSQETVTFGASAMSDGTRHALGVLVALLQSYGDPIDRPSLIGIEEPESLLHPAAASVLLGCLRNASLDTQVIVTSHSPDLLDDKDIDSDCILAVSSDDGATTIGPIDEVGRSVLRDRLFTAGELLRMNQLTPDPGYLRETANHKPQLFGEMTAP